MNRTPTLLLLMLAAASLPACTKGEAPKVSAAAPEIPAAADPIATTEPPASPVHAASAPVSGTVAETMEAASYTYVRLTTADGETWAAIPQAKLSVGDRVTIANPMVIEGFQSPTLKRRFDRILFGTLAGEPPPAASARNPHAGMSGMGMMTQELPAGPAVPRATGANAHTVAELYSGKEKLSGKPVILRGRVTKYNAGILGKNWLHVADGSAKAPADSSIVVTSQGTATPGDVVVVQGVLRTDKDFGSGYSYPVMIEDATLTN
jgi:hypothetical protein